MHDPLEQTRREIQQREAAMRAQHLIQAQHDWHAAARSARKTANIGYQIMKWTLIGTAIAVIGLGTALCLFLSLI